MSIFNRALYVINETYADEYVKQHMTPLKVTQALADAGLLAPEPHVIHTLTDLESIDPDTILGDSVGPYAADDAVDAIYEDDDEGRDYLPAVVVATGDQVRAARQALEAADATD